jgi:hypothetical protein
METTDNGRHLHESGVYTHNLGDELFITQIELIIHSICAPGDPGYPGGRRIFC